MFYKALRIIIIWILVYYIVGFAVSPIPRYFGTQYPILVILFSFIIFIIETALVFYLAGKFLSLKTGEAKKLTVTIVIVSLVFALYGVISSRIVVSNFNAISGEPPIQNISIWPAIISELIQAVVIYYLGVLILRKSEIPDSNNIAS